MAGSCYLRLVTVLWSIKLFAYQILHCLVSYYVIDYGITYLIKLSYYVKEILAYVTQTTKQCIPYTDTMKFYWS